MTVTIPAMLTEIEADPVAYIEAAKAAAPVLTCEGWGHINLYAAHDPVTARRLMTTPASVAEFLQASQWLAQARRRKVGRSTSYYWKHVASSWHEARAKAAGRSGDGYITNGMFIAACLAIGVAVHPLPDSPNPVVGL